MSRAWFAVVGALVFASCTKGPQGAQGEPGPAGDAGAMGVMGVAGPMGPLGDAGAEGAPGAMGDAGLQGSAGPAGPSGPAGATVAPLDAGSACPSGGALLSLPDGGSTFVCRGVDGATGDAGVPGAPGPTGLSTLTKWRLATDAECPGLGGGKVLESGVDVDRSNVLEPSEVTRRTPVCMTIVKRVFITNVPTTAVLGLAADTVCQNAANAAQLLGTFMAWSSDFNGGTPTSPSTRFTQSTVPYVRLDGVLVASNWADLTDGTIDKPINVNQNGVLIASSNVWTNTTVSGTMTNGSACNSSALAGNGLSSAGDFRWTANGSLNCTLLTARLYCFEQ